MNWFVFEFQGTAALVFSYTNKADAWAKYYEVLMYAAKSSVPLHGAMLINSDQTEYHMQMAERPAAVEPEVEAE